MAYVGNTPFGPSCPAPTRVFAQVNTGFRSVRRSVGLAHDPTSQETPARARARAVRSSGVCQGADSGGLHRRLAGCAAAFLLRARRVTGWLTGQPRPPSTLSLIHI